MINIIKTQEKHLALDFRKNSIIELTDKETFSVNGGTGYVCSNCITSIRSFVSLEQIITTIKINKIFVKSIAH